MATEKQIAANRRNAALSTGPRSAGGRSRSSRNATRHGLTSQKEPHAGAANRLRLAAMIAASSLKCEPDAACNDAVQNFASALLHLKRVREAFNLVLIAFEREVDSRAERTVTIESHERYLADADRRLRMAEALLAPLICG